MNEQLVRGLIIGAALAIVAVIGMLIQRLMRSRSEAARRTRIVLGAIVTLAVGSLVLEVFGPAVTGGLLLIFCAGLWIHAGKGK